MMRVPTGSFSYRYSSPYAIRRFSERRFTVTTRSRRAPTWCLRSAGLSSLSFASGRAIRGSPRKFKDGGAGRVVRLVIGGFVKSQDRPVATQRGCTQLAIGIHCHGVPERNQKRQIIVRIRVAPALAQIEVVLDGETQAPLGLFVRGHDGLRQSAGGARLRDDQTISCEIPNLKLTAKWRHDEVR